MSRLALLLFLVAGLIVVIRSTGQAHDSGRFKPATLGDKVAAACAPMIVGDWHVDYTDPTLLQVSCYDPKTSRGKTTVVER